MKLYLHIGGMMSIKIHSCIAGMSLVFMTAMISHAVVVSVDPSMQYQTITGIGSSEDEESAVRVSDAAADEVVKDLGASAYRLFHDFDLFDFEKTNDNNDPNVTNWSAFNYTRINNYIKYMKKLKSRGMNYFFYSVLAVPVWMKINVPRQDTVAFWCSGQCGGEIDTTKYEEYAECVYAWCKVLKDSSMEMDAIGLQNEPTFDEPYGSCRIYQKQFRDLAKVVGRRFAKEGLRTKIIASEEVLSNWMSARSYITTINDDTAARKYMKTAAAIHNYAGDGVTASSPAAMAWDALYKIAAKYGQETWMTETSGFSNDWAGAWRSAQVMFGAFKYGKLSLWTWLEFPIKSSWPQTFAITKHFSKNIRPGAIQIQSSSPDTNLLVLTFRDTAQKKIIGVLMNRTDAAVTVQLTGNSMPAQVHLYQSTSSSLYNDAGMVSSGTMTLLANSVNTFVGDNYTPPPVHIARPQVDVRVSGTSGLVPHRVFDLRGRSSSEKIDGLRNGTGIFFTRQNVRNYSVSKRVIVN